MPGVWSSQGRQAVRLVRAGRLSGLSRREARRVVRAGNLVRVAPGGVVVRHGGPVIGAYVLLSGAASVARGGEEIARVAAGDVIGEIALVDAIPHTASVVAVDEVRALHLTTPVARELMATLPPFRAAIQETAAERLARDRRREGG